MIVAYKRVLYKGVHTMTTKKNLSPLGDDSLIDNGLSTVPMHFQMNVGDHPIKIGPEVLKHMFAVQDVDLMNTHAMTLSNLHTTGPSAIGVTVSGMGGEQSPIAERVSSVRAKSGSVESVHAIVSPHFTADPVTLTLADAHNDASVIKTAVARVARWANTDVSNLRNDVEDIEAGGVTRHLVPACPAEGASPIATLFARNAENPAFYNKRYSKAQRNNVGDSFVVTKADMTHATNSLVDNLTTKSSLRNGIQINASALHGDKALGTVSGMLSFHRTPLSPAHIEGTVPADSKAMSLSSALTLMGDTGVVPTTAHSGGEKAHAAFQFEMAD